MCDVHAGLQLLPQSPDDEPIYRRTRTRLPMDHINLDDLDQLLADEGDELFDEEGEQYRQFLRVRCPPVHQQCCPVSVAF